MKYLKLFSNHTAYNAAKNSLDKPNVSLCDFEEEVHFNDKDQRVSLLFNLRVLPQGSIDILYATASSSFSEVEVDGVTLPNVSSTYTFQTTGEHIIRYSFVNSNEIPQSAFYDVSCDQVFIPNNITSIGDRSFYNTAITSIEIPDSVTNIGSNVFASGELIDATIGTGIINIGSYAFNNPNIQSITIKATTPPRIQSDTFYSGTDIFVPAESVNTYKAASGWSSYASQIQAIPAN